MDYLTTLQALNACHGPSGREGKISQGHKQLAGPFADDCFSDGLGNLVVHSKGAGAKLMRAAHMDSLG